jgi:hypothetical protein
MRLYSPRTISIPTPVAKETAQLKIGEVLPFTVKLVSSEKDLLKAVQIRHAAYNRHLPDFAEKLREPEPMDMEKGTVILLAQSKVDGAPLGTMRIQTNRYHGLPLEQSVNLPEHLQGQVLAEATRLGVTEERIGRLVKNYLFKAFFLYCQQTRVDNMVIAGRSPVDRQYERLLFQDIYPEPVYYPMKHAADMGHRVMFLSVANARAIWSDAKHPLFEFIFETFHDDINLLTTFAEAWKRTTKQ